MFTYLRLACQLVCCHSAIVYGLLVVNSDILLLYLEFTDGSDSI